MIQKYQEQHICDKNGKVTYPKDVGATKFYDIGFEGGYILAEVVESTFDSTVKKVGIMNTNFEWTVGPTEELYKYINELNSAISHLEDKYFNDIVYIDNAKVYLDLKTGKIASYEEIVSKLPSDAWTPYTNGVYKLHDKTMLDMSEKYDNIYSCSAFCKGKSVVVFKNKETMEYYFTIIDESGNIAFEPKCIGKNYYYMEFDGESIVFVLDNYHTRISHCKLDENELSTFGIGESSTWYHVGDNVVRKKLFIGNYSSKITYYDLNHNPLF